MDEQTNMPDGSLLKFHETLVECGYTELDIAHVYRLVSNLLGSSRSAASIEIQKRALQGLTADEVIQGWQKSAWEAARDDAPAVSDGDEGAR